MEKNWSVSLEHDDYENNLELVVTDGMDAVEQTGTGYYVNLVTPEKFGYPDYLMVALEMYFKDRITMSYIDQCGCGGYVLRVWKNK